MKVAVEAWSGSANKWARCGNESNEKNSRRVNGGDPVGLWILYFADAIRPRQCVSPALGRFGGRDAKPGAIRTGFSKIDVKRMAAEKALPEDMRYDAKTGRLFNEWNGEVALGSWGKDIAKFAIEFKGVPKKECAKLIMAFSALEGSNFERVEVNGKMVPKFKRADLLEEGLAHCGLEKGNEMVLIGS